MTQITRVVVNIHRSETVIYLLEGNYDQEGALAAVESGKYDPTDSKVHREDIDIVSLAWRGRDT